MSTPAPQLFGGVCSYCSNEAMVLFLVAGLDGYEGWACPECLELKFQELEESQCAECGAYLQNSFMSPTDTFVSLQKPYCRTCWLGREKAVDTDVDKLIRLFDLQTKKEVRSFSKNPFGNQSRERTKCKK